jgi:Fibronectin type III domain
MEKRDRMMKAIAPCLIFTSFLFLSGCGGGSDGVPEVSSSTAQTGAIATLAWDPVQDPSITGYYVHYGRNSSGEPGSCSYEEAQFVSSPSIAIANLDNDTRYYFAVSAYNGLESSCSNEVSTVTPASQA